jgi:hypothetical protein
MSTNLIHVLVVAYNVDWGTADWFFTHRVTASREMLAKTIRWLTAQAMTLETDRNRRPQTNLKEIVHLKDSAQP